MTKLQAFYSHPFNFLYSKIHICYKQQIGFSNLINNNVYIPDTMLDEQYPNLKRNSNSLNKWSNFYSARIFFIICKKLRIFIILYKSIDYYFMI